jgi:ribosomal protein S18 acetylase RimI-like enzyme
MINMSEKNYSLRPATQDDMKFIYNLEKETMMPHVVATWGSWDEAHFENYFGEKTKTSDFYVVLVDERSVGALYLYEKDHEVEVQGIYVLPEHQNGGLGAEVLRDVIVNAKADQKFVSLRVLKVSPAQRFYKRLGFSIVDEDDEFFYLQHPF